MRLNERVAHKQQDSHPELPAGAYARVQQALDDVAPQPDELPRRWRFDLPDPARPGRIIRVVVEVEDGRPELVTVHLRRGKKKRGKKKGRAD